MRACTVKAQRFICFLSSAPFHLPPKIHAAAVDGRCSTPAEDGAGERTTRVGRPRGKKERKKTGLEGGEEDSDRDPPARASRISFSVYVALTYIPGGGLLTGFAMRSDPNDERGIRKIISLPPKRKSTATHRAHASIHLAGRRSGPARLLRSTRGPTFWPSEAAAGHTGGSVRSSTQTRSSKKSGVCVKAARHGKGRR